MKKYIFFLMGVVCFLLSSLAVHANELNKSDANIIGHVSLIPQHYNLTLFISS